MTQIDTRRLPVDTNTLHRILLMLAAASLFIGTRSTWSSLIINKPILGVVITIGYGAILAAFICALTLKREHLIFIDTLLLGTAIVLFLGAYPSGGVTDEAAFTYRAAEALMHGQHVYGIAWPELFKLPNVGLTKTMDGGGDYTFAYPPLAALLTAPLTALHLPLGVLGGPRAIVTLVVVAFFIAGAIVAWLLVPSPWKSVVVMLFFGFGIIAPNVYSGYPAIIALVLFVPVIFAWHRTGESGKLRWFGIVQAILFGLACSAQQLAWFIAPFLVVGIFLVQRKQGWRTSLWLVAKFVIIALVVFFAVNAYFIIQSPKAWFEGLFLPLSQHAILHGQGIMSVSYYLLPGSGALDFYSYATILVFAASLILMILFPARLLPLMVFLPLVSFYFATRSQEGYYTLMLPLLFIAFITVPMHELAIVKSPVPLDKLPKLLRQFVPVILLLPAAICLIVALATPSPLKMSIDKLNYNNDKTKVTSAEITVTNNSNASLKPSYATQGGVGASGYWRASKAGAIKPHQTVHLTVTSQTGGQSITKAYRQRYLLIAVTDRPMTMVTVRMPIPVK